MTQSKFFEEIFQCCDRQRSITYHKHFSTNPKHYKTNLNSPTTSPPYHFYSFSNHHHLHPKISIKLKKNQLNLPIKKANIQSNKHPPNNQPPTPNNQKILTHHQLIQPNARVYRPSYNIISHDSHVPNHHMIYLPNNKHHINTQHYHRYQSSFQPNILINYKSNPQLITSLPKILEQVSTPTKIHKTSLKSHQQQHQNKISSQPIKNHQIIQSKSNNQRQSELENIKQSCISKNSQIQIAFQVEKNQVKGQINHSNVINPQNHNSNAPSFINNNQENVGLSIISINSGLEQVSYSKIKQNVQQSVVMHDFFNPAKKLFNKWGDKKKN